MTSSLLHPRVPTDVALHPVLAQRWSPRSFDPEAEVGEAELRAVLEAARWAPSAGNRQPWQLVVARRGTPLHDAVAGTLLHSNRVWAPDAAVLVVGLARTRVDGARHDVARYDLGGAVAHLSVQATAEGLVTHQMGGFDAAALHAVLGLDDEHEPLVVVALGHVASPDRLPDHLRERELAPRTRQELDALVRIDPAPATTAA